MQKFFICLLSVALLFGLTGAGIAQNTTLVKDINAERRASDPYHFVDYNGVAYFTAYRADVGEELWMSDGTEAGTRLVKDIYPGTCSSSIMSLRVWNGLLYFGADEGEHGVELWMSDGTEAGTVLVKDINPGPPSFLLTVSWFRTEDYSSTRMTGCMVRSCG
ncbi:ELWxxDGT repeat protein [Acidobacteriota bacterium]